MVRKFIKALLAGSLLLPTLGFGVGLGDIHLHSGLNQQLDAEIDLLSVEPSEADKITASLASYETFGKLGIDRPAVLMLMNFEVQKRPNGTPFIKLRSKQLINEPFLDFLVEVTWPSGKVLREYTLLLDPPTMTAQQEPLMVQTPQVEQVPAAPQVPQPVPEPVVSAPVDMATAPIATEPQPSPAPAAGEQAAAQGQAAEQQAPQAQEAPAQETPAPETQQAPAEAAPAAQAAAPQPAPERTTGRWPEEKKPLVEPAAAPAEALSYGPVKRNETLYRIASKMRPDESISVDQMMIALYNSNREAFMQNNINLLRKGAVLRIEDPAALRAMTQAEARRQVARHGRAWEEYRSKVAARTPKSVPEEKSATEAVKAGAAAPAKEESKLTLVAPSKPGEKKQATVGGTSEKGGDTESLRKELLLANESAVARRKENEELNKRLKELEGQLDQMQKLLTLKDDNLAAMQQKLAVEQKEAAAAKSAPEGAKPAQATPVQPAAPAPQQPLVEPAKITEPAAKAPEPAAKAPEPAPQAPDTASKTPESAVKTPETPASGNGAAPAAGTATAPVEGAAAPAGGVTPEPATQAQAQPAKPKRPKQVVPPPPPPEPSLVDDLLNNSTLLIGGGIVLVLLALGGVVMMRKRRQGRGFQESILTVGATSSMMKGKGDNPASETSFLSDLAISGMGGRVQEESEVDPLTEADVYMAYNRYPQAEELLKEGLKHNPEREELHAKLLEVYYKSKNRKAYEQVAESRYPTMQKNQSMWQKVVAMGHELAPDNPLFAGAAVAGGAALLAESGQASAATNEVFDIGLDLDALSNEMEAAGADNSDFVDLGLDFSDLGMDDSSKKKPEESIAAAPTEDFNFSLGETTEAPVESTESPSFDFDLSSFGANAEPAHAVAEEAVQPEESALGGLDFDLSSMAEAAPAEEEQAVSLDFGDFDLGSMATETPAVEAESGFDLSSLDLGGDSDVALSPDTGSEPIDFGDLDLGGDTAEPAMDLAGLGDFGDFGDLGGGDSLGDEVGTKLDLAKAYVDMGDSEGARGMLEEVMQEGSDEQKRQAKELLAQIA